MADIKENVFDGVTEVLDNADIDELIERGDHEWLKKVLIAIAAVGGSYVVYRLGKKLVIKVKASGKIKLPKAKKDGKETRKLLRLLSKNKDLVVVKDETEEEAE